MKQICINQKQKDKLKNTTTNIINNQHKIMSIKCKFKLSTGHKIHEYINSYKNKTFNSPIMW